jgi:hypothetical protein
LNRSQSFRGLMRKNFNKLNSSSTLFCLRTRASAYCFYSLGEIYIGVPVKHQRNFPCSSQQATAFFVLRFLILCASSGSRCELGLRIFQDKILPKTMRHHLISKRGQTLGLVLAGALPFFAATVRPKWSASLSESESESALAFALLAAVLSSFLAVGANAACSDRTVSYVVMTT